MIIKGIDLQDGWPQEVQVHSEKRFLLGAQPADSHENPLWKCQCHIVTTAADWVSREQMQRPTLDLNIGLKLSYSVFKIHDILPFSHFLSPTLCKYWGKFWKQNRGYRTTAAGQFVVNLRRRKVRNTGLWLHHRMTTIHWTVLLRWGNWHLELTGGFWLCLVLFRMPHAYWGRQHVPGVPSSALTD